MTGISDQILVFYILGIILFIIGIENRKIPHTFIYLGLSFLINIMGYFISYDDMDFLKTAYLPLVLSMISIVFLVYYGFETLKVKMDDSYKDQEE